MYDHFSAFLWHDQIYASTQGLQKQTNKNTYIDLLDLLIDHQTNCHL